MKFRTLAPFAVAILLCAGFVVSQDVIYQRPLSSRGYSSGIGVGTEWPTLANANKGGKDGELFVRVNSNSVGPTEEGPTLGIYTEEATPGWTPLIQAASNSINLPIPTGGYTRLINSTGTVYAQFSDRALSFEAFKLAVSASTMNGSDTQAMFSIEVTNADHGGADNYLYGLNIDDIVNSPATEHALRIGDWDREIAFTSTSPTVNAVANGANLGFWIRDGSVALTLRDNNGASEDILELNSPTGTMDGGDTTNFFVVDTTLGTITGAGNTVNLMLIDDFEGDANTDLNGLLVGTLTGTAGAAGELEYAIHVEPGWDGAFYHEGIAHASLVATDNGSFVFCTDCDPASTPCTSAGAQTGAFAFRVNGAWDCPW